jgi:hypothetical protein
MPIYILQMHCVSRMNDTTVKKISRQALGDWYPQQDYTPRRLFYPAWLHHWGTIIRAGLPAQETQIPRNPTVPAQEAYIPTRSTSPGDTFPQQARQQRRQKYPQQVQLPRRDVPIGPTTEGLPAQEAHILSRPTVH